MLVLIGFLFYGEEDWRGKRAWEKCKRDLAAKGQHLDPQYFIPPRLPDDQNILKAPKMADWFAGHFYVGAPATDLSARLSSRQLGESLAIAQIRVLLPGMNATNVSVKTAASATDAAATNVVEEIKLDSVALTDAIHALATQAGLNVMFDPVLFQAGVTPGVLARNPKVTANWRKITAAQALFVLLNTYGMELVVDATTRVARVKPVDPAAAPSPLATPPANVGATDPLVSADLVLDYDSSGKITNPRSDGPGSEVVGVVSFENVPLTDAIRAIAIQAHRNILFDPALTQDGSTNGPLARNPSITEKWKGISPDQALLALLANRGMILMEDPVTHLDRVTAGDSAEVRSAAQRFARRPDVHAAVASLLRRAQGLAVLSPLGYLLTQYHLDQIKPIRIVLRSNSALNAAEIESFIKEFLPDGLFAYGGLVVTVDPADQKTFKAVIPVESAVDFLAWSDKLEPEFDLIRQGLQRAQSQGEDYQTYFEGPQQTPSYATVRTVAQALAERAQCHLLLGQPDMALRDLTLVHDLPRAFATRPISLVQAMITVAVGGLYTEIVADGLRLQAWREPELAALEQQLLSINWPPLLSEALTTERVFNCQRIERMTPPEFGALLTNWFNTQQASRPAGSKSVNPFLRLVPSRWIFPQNHWLMDKLFAAIPRGWRYRNMVTATLLKQELIDSIDLSNCLVLPEKANLYGHDVDLAAKASSPYTFVASLFAANMSRMVSVTAHNQTAINQACVACALERYRLALGRYPEALDALVPGFLEKLPRDLIGGQPLKYRRETDGTFLLYSIGWNEKDDGGVPGPGYGYITNGDWVWQKNSP
ncbi:MAG TPA: hypothetical protein VGR14_16240 [Verrucomicrobiae bacterium]|nr:hypothetical protein [Verrucomicrobiae bacterium]